MKTPQFADPQFVDAVGIGGLNAAFGAISGSAAEIANKVFPVPGLLRPESATVGFTGLAASVDISPPFAIRFSTGPITAAHGTSTGLDSSVYAVSFSGLVPASGSTTVYLLLQALDIQEIPVPLPGPPQGHPSFNPNFQPTVGYAQSVDSISVIPSTAAPDNATTFELGRGSLSSASALTGWTTSFQVRATANDGKSYTFVSSSTAVSAQTLQQALINLAAAPITTTLPPAQLCTGLQPLFINESNSTWTLTRNGSPDKFVGFSAANANSITVPPNGSVRMYCDGQFWILDGTSLNFLQLPADTLYGNPTGVQAGAVPIPLASGVAFVGGAFGALLGNMLGFDTSGAIAILGSAFQQTTNGSNHTAPVTTGGLPPFPYTNLQASVNFTFPSGAPAYLLFVDSTVNVGPTPNGIPTFTDPNYALMQFAEAITSVFDNTNGGETLFVADNGGPLVLTANVGAGQNVKKNGFSPFKGLPNQVVNLTQRVALANTGSYAFSSATVKGYLTLTAVPIPG